MKKINFRSIKSKNRFRKKKIRKIILQTEKKKMKRTEKEKEKTENGVQHKPTHGKREKKRQR